MDMQRFHELCAAYGAERRRWPESQRALFDEGANTVDGARVLAEAHRLDARLDEWREVGVDATRHARILAAVCASPRRRLTAGWLSTAFAACAILGFAVGFLQVADEQPDSDLYAELLLGNSVMEELQ